MEQLLVAVKGQFLKHLRRLKANYNQIRCGVIGIQSHPMQCLSSLEIIDCSRLMWRSFIHSFPIPLSPALRVAGFAGVYPSSFGGRGRGEIKQTAIKTSLSQAHTKRQARLCNLESQVWLTCKLFGLWEVGRNRLCGRVTLQTKNNVFWPWVLNAWVLYNSSGSPWTLHQFSAAFPHSLVPPSAHVNYGLHHSRKLWANSATRMGKKWQHIATGHG